MESLDLIFQSKNAFEKWREIFVDKKGIACKLGFIKNAYLFLFSI